MFFWDLVLSIPFVYFAFFICYYFFFSIAGLIKGPVPLTVFRQPPGRFAIMIPAYKEDFVIIDTAIRNLEQNYPSEFVEIVIVADSLKKETIERLGTLPIRTIEVRFEVSRKAKAIEVAINQLDSRNYDFIVILDADNVMKPDFLLKMNERLQGGALVVQGHRTAKNSENSMAVLDSVSEEINNHIFRYSHYAVGLSSALIGSGMAFKFDYYKQISAGIEDVWEDRELEFRILKDEVRIEYLSDAIVLDEKVTNNTVFKNQRSKWLAGQIHYLKKYSFSNWPAIFRGNLNLLDKIIQTLSPPRSILIGSIPLFLIICSLSGAGPSLSSWLILLAVYILTLALAIPKRLYNQKLLRATLQLPQAVFAMFLGLLKSIKSQNISFNTPHDVK